MGSSGSRSGPARPTKTPNGVPFPERLNKYGLLHLNPNHHGSTSPDEYPIDIVAIHGLTGDAYTTWTADNGAFWLRDFLPKTFPGARIFSFGYPADIFFSLGTGDFETFARTLLEDVKGVRRRRKVRLSVLGRALEDHSQQSRSSSDLLFLSVTAWVGLL